MSMVASRSPLNSTVGRLKVGISDGSQLKTDERQNTEIDPVDGGVATHVHMFSDFPEMLMAKLNEQRRQSVMCDVTIVTKDGQSFRAHKSVLAASSHYLESELCSLNDDNLDPKAEAVMHLGMISSVSFSTLLDLVYTSKLVLTQENVADVLLAADILDLEQVGTICRQFLRSQIKSTSVSRKTLRRDSPKDCLSTDADINNNVLELGQHKNIGQRESTDSTSSSSSGFSSSSFFRSEKSDQITSFDCNEDSMMEVDNNSFARVNVCSTSDMANKFPGADDGMHFQGDRATSAPAMLLKGQKSSLAQAGDDLCDLFGSKGENPSKEKNPCEVGKRWRRSSVPIVSGSENNLPPRLLNIPSHETQGRAQKHWRTTGCRMPSSCADGDPDLIPPTEMSQYRVKGEIISDFTVQGNSGITCHEEVEPFPTDSNNDAASGLRSEEQNKVSSDDGLSRREGGPQQDMLFSPSEDQAHLPHFRSSSNESSPYAEHQSGFVDLSATQIQHRRKAKSDEQYGKCLIPASSLPASPQGLFSNTSSFLASLYMLRSQGTLNPIGLLNSTCGMQNQSHTGDMRGMMPGRHHHANPPALASPSFGKRQLHQSNSVVTSSALFCKICRLEFTSEWSLSMHCRFYHPFNYLYQSPTKPPNEHSTSIVDATGYQGNASVVPRPHPLARSSSSPCRYEMSGTRDGGQRAKSIMKNLELPRVVNTAPSHKCYHCKKEFATIFLLRKHKSTEHMKRPYKCHRCDSAFPNKAGLSVHLRSHTGERPYRCKVCDKAFTQLGHVQRHQKVHTGEKPYQCPLCQARVRDKASMHYHILAHQGVKPFKCEQCDARFTKRSSLVKHNNVHTGAFLYQCSQCKASFREKASLSRHVRSQHKEPCFTASLGHVPSVQLESIPPSPEGSRRSLGSSPVNLTMDTHVDVVEVS